MPVPQPQASRWLAAEAARPLAWCSNRQRAAMAAALGSVLAEWRNAWGLPTAAHAPRCAAVPADQDWSGTWHVFLRANVPSAWLQPIELAAAARLLFAGAGSVGPLMLSVAARCCSDRSARVAQALSLVDAGAEGASPLPAELRPWSGGVHALCGGDAPLRLLVGGEAVRAWTAAHGGTNAATARPARQPLQSTVHVLRDRPMALRIRLAECRLALGELGDLQVGDIVRVPHLLATPARVSLGDAGPVFAAHLGCVGQRKAVELANATASQQTAITQGAP
jgi:hypothetical protein